MYEIFTIIIFSCIIIITLFIKELYYIIYQNITLQDLMLYYQEQSKYITYIPYNSVYIIRLDRKNFKKNKNDVSSYHLLFAETMMQTAKDIINKYNTITIYSHINEMNIIFVNKSYHSTHEILSSISSYASTRFAIHFNNTIMKINNKRYNKNNNMELHFYFKANLIVFPKNDNNVVKYIYWRYKDCFRNLISHISFNYFNANDLQHKTTIERINMLINKNVNIQKMNSSIKYGWIIKKHKTEYMNENNIIYKRNVPIAKNIEIKLDQNITSILLSNTWN